MPKAKWITNSSTFELCSMGLEEVANLDVDPKTTKKIVTILKEIKERNMDTDKTVLGLADQIMALSAEIKEQYTAESVAIDAIEKAEVVEGMPLEEKKTKRSTRKEPEKEKEEVTEEAPKKKRGRPGRKSKKEKEATENVEEKDSNELDKAGMKKALKKLGYSKEDISKMSKKEMRSALNAQ